MLLLVNNVHEKTLQKVKTDKILKMSVLFCILVTTLQLCYMGMHSFSANLMRIFFYVHYQLYPN